jgi:hypothetical protein
MQGNPSGLKEGVKVRKEVVYTEKRRQKTLVVKTD